MSKLATIFGPVGSRRRKVMASLLSFVVATLVGTLIFHRPYFSMVTSAGVAISLYFSSPKPDAEKFTDIKF